MLRKYAHLERIQGELGEKEALRRLWPHLAHLKLPLIAGIIFTLLSSGLSLFYGKIVKDLFDHVTKSGGHILMGKVNYYVTVAVVLAIVRAFLYFGTNYAWAYATNRLIMRLRNLVFIQIQNMSISFFDYRKTGQLMSCLSNDVNGVGNVFDAIQDSTSAPFILLGGTVLLFVINWKLALVAGLVLPVVAVLIVRSNKKVKTFSRKLQAGRASLLDLAHESISGIRAVKSFGNEQHEIDKFLARSAGVMTAILKAQYARLIMRPAIEFLGTISVVAVLWFGGWELSQQMKDVTIGNLLWFVIVLKQVADAAQDVGKIATTTTSAMVSADRVFTMLSYQPEIQEKPDAIPLQAVEGRVQFDHVRFAYSAGIPVLEDITFTIEPGQVVALVGPTGAGKTTIAALIPRFYDVSGGAVKIDGVDVRDCTLQSLRNQIGIVPQDTILFSGTLRDNIAYGRLGATEEEIIHAAKVANAWEFIERFPEGLDSTIGERGLRLSGGQRQRIAIARAVLRDPRVLILDEATSSLDAQSEALVQNALQKLVQNRTTLVIAHRLSTIRSADKILVLKEGHIVEAGQHDELMARGGVYSHLYMTQYESQASGLRPGVREEREERLEREGREERERAEAKASRAAWAEPIPGEE